MKPLDLSENAVWKKRYLAPIVLATQLAKNNPKRGVAVTNKTGVYQLHSWNTESNDLHQVTDAYAGVMFGAISSDGDYIYHLQDNSGEEIGHYVRIPFDGGEAEDITPDLPKYSSFNLSESTNGTVLGFVAAYDGHTHLYTMRQHTDKSLDSPELLYKSQHSSAGPFLNYDGKYAIVSTSENSQYLEFSLIAFDLSQSESPIGTLEEESGSLSVIGFAPLSGDTRLLASTSISGFERPLIWDIKTGERTDIPLTEFEGEVTPLGWSQDGEKILLQQLSQAQFQLYTYNLKTGEINKLNHPSGSFNSGYFAQGDSEIWVNWQDSTQPSRVIALDAQTGELKHTILTGGDAPTSIKWRSVQFQSTEDALIQAWVATPEGKGPYPTILHTHGGPTWFQAEVFNPMAQTWLDHGFAFMSVNYRGSTTFGHEFQHAIDGNLGHREVDDMAAGYQWLVDNQVAIPDEVFLTGGSYGGYLTLQGLGKRPDLWAGGMGDVVVADWKLMYEDQAVTLQGYLRSLFGGTPDELPEQHRISSPTTYVEDVKAPLLVIQGENDTRCPARQFRAYEEKMRENDKDIMVHWFDAGHGSRKMNEQIDHMELRLRWIYRILG